MFTTVCSAAVYGLQAYLVRVEVDLAGGLPSFQLVGSLGSEVKEYNSFSPNVVFAYFRQAEAASVAYP